MLFIVAFTLVSIWLDYETLKRTYIYEHRTRWILRFIFVVAVARTPEQAIGMGLFFTALFEGGLNLVLGLPFLHLGNTALWDRFFIRMPRLYVIVKMVSLIVGVYLLC